MSHYLDVVANMRDLEEVTSLLVQYGLPWDLRRHVHEGIFSQA